jgi:hypothetical protein
MMRWLIVCACVLAVASQAQAETRRIAVVVGHNTGHGGRPLLRYAESDAGKFARVLREIGKVSGGDVLLLQGRSLFEVERAISDAAGHVAAAHRAPDVRALLLFYYSGHSDGEALELGREKLSFSRLRELLAGTGADVRVVIIDACKSGAATLAKGGKPAPPFTIRLTDDLNASGEVILAASAADEVALESREVRGSFFTHHLVSGLRGAADISADRRVTLNEAYRYAYDRTVSSSTATLEGPHHPTYDMRLTGQGELVLSFLDQVASGILLPDDFDRALIIQLARDQVVAELTAASARALALPPGGYAVRVVHRGKVFAARIDLPRDRVRRIDWADLKAIGRAEVALAKGTPGVSVRHEWEPAVWRLALSGGLAQGVADRLGTGGTLRIALERGRPVGWSFAVQGMFGAGTDDSFYEQMIQLRAGYSLGFAREWFGAWIGIEAGPGFVWQSVDGEVSGATLSMAFGPRLGLLLRLTRSFSITVEAEALLGMLKLDDHIQPALFPSALLGFSLAL